jgi:5-methyltetrahydrofolate--homocysteine methyltransferase
LPTSGNEHGRDAFADLRFMDAFVAARANGDWQNGQGFLQGAPEGLGLTREPEATDGATPAPEDPAHASDQPGGTSEAEELATPAAPAPLDISRSAAVPEELALTPPFWGSRILTEADIDLAEVFGYLDRNALFAGQWQLRKTQQQSRPDYEAMLAEKAEPVLQHWMGRCLEEGLLTPRMAYGYFPCGRSGNDLVVFAAPHGSDAEPGAELGRFQLPRQRAGNRYCIADFYRDLVEVDPSQQGARNQAPAGLGPSDVLPMQAVTMGERATRVAQELFQGDRYSDYLYFHGLAVQMAEALAEWTHARIRRELGFGASEPAELRDVLAQRYRGSRYSFGYPACPNVADSRQQLAWLGADRIGLRMDESDQLEPEQSTTALVALHSQARYFSA